MNGLVKEDRLTGRGDRTYTNLAYGRPKNLLTCADSINNILPPPQKKIDTYELRKNELGLGLRISSRFVFPISSSLYALISSNLYLTDSV